MPEDLSEFLRRATVDDVLAIMAQDDVDDGMSTLRFLFEQLAAARKTSTGRPRTKKA